MVQNGVNNYMSYHNPHIKGQSFIPNKSPKQQKLGPFFHCSTSWCGFPQNVDKEHLDPFGVQSKSCRLRGPQRPLLMASSATMFLFSLLMPFCLKSSRLLSLTVPEPNSLPLQFFPGCCQSWPPIPGCVQSHSKCYVRTSPHASHVVVLLVLNLGVTRIDPNLFFRKLVPEQFENWIMVFFAVCDVDG